MKRAIFVMLIGCGLASSAQGTHQVAQFNNTEKRSAQTPKRQYRNEQQRVLQLVNLMGRQGEEGIRRPYLYFHLETTAGSANRLLQKFAHLFVSFQGSDGRRLKLSDKGKLLKNKMDELAEKYADVWTKFSTSGSLASSRPGVPAWAEMDPHEIIGSNTKGGRKSDDSPANVSDMTNQQAIDWEKTNDDNWALLMEPRSK